MEDLDAQALFLPRVLMRLVYVLLLCFPLIFYRQEYGFLHPLILPTLFTTLKEVAKFPLALIVPHKLPLFSFDVSSLSPAASIQSLSYHDLAWTRLEYQAVGCLALVCYYAGYFAVRHFRASGIHFHPPRHLGPICFGVTMACVLVSAYFIQMHGGLGSLLVAMRGGRHALFEGQGQFLQVARFAALPALVWFAYARRPLLNPWWLAAIAAASFAAILTTGSRSTFVYPLIVLLLVWWRKAGRVLIVPALAVALVAIVATGTFGAIRQDYGSTTVDTSVLRVNALGANIAYAQAEFKKRNAEESNLAGYAGARDGLLLGRSYVGALTFFIPRAVWPGKPFTGGAYNMGVNFAGRSVDSYDQGTTHGIPLSPVSEAYWNFSLPGVVVLFFLLGMFYRWLSMLVWRNAHAPAVLIAAAWITINFTGTSVSFVNTIRDIIMLSALYYALRIWRPTFLMRNTARRVSLTTRATLDPGTEGRP